MRKIISIVFTVLFIFCFTNLNSFAFLNPFKKKVIGELLEDYNNGKMEERFNEELKLFLMSYSKEIKDFMINEIDKMLEI